ncbi:MAG: MFS transporter [Halobacteriales archaeon]
MSSLSAVREEFLAVARDRERAGLLAAYALLFVVTDAYAQVLPLHYRAVGVSIAALGVAKSVANAVEAAASTPVGILADEGDRAAVAVATGGVMAVVLAAFPFAASAVTLGALVVAYAAARLAFGVAATPLLSESFADGSEGVGWAVRDVGIYAGGAVGTAGAGVVVARVAGVAPVFLALVPAALALVAVLAYTHRPTWDLGVSRRDLLAGWPPNPVASIRAISRPRVLARFLAVKLLGGLGWGLSMFLLPVYAVDLGVAASAFLLAFGAAHVASIPFTLVGGMLTDRLDRKRLFVGNYAIKVAMLGTFALAGGAPLFAVGLSLFVVQTTFEPAVLAYFFDQFDDDESGRAWGVTGTVARGVGVVAPAAGAAIYEVEPGLTFGAGAAAMAGATLVALTLPD